jgi:hypothetical protein
MMRCDAVLPWLESHIIGDARLACRASQDHGQEPCIACIHNARVRNTTLSEMILRASKTIEPEVLLASIRLIGESRQRNQYNS